VEVEDNDLDLDGKIAPRPQQRGAGQGLAGSKGLGKGDRAQDTERYLGELAALERVKLHRELQKE